MAGKIIEIIDSIIQERSKENPIIVEMTKAKLILKGINPDHYTRTSEDDPSIMEKLYNFRKQFSDNTVESESPNLKSVFSSARDEAEAVLDLKKQCDNITVKLLIFFASSVYNQDRLSSLMQDAFPGSLVFGCSTAGEIINTELASNSVVAMAFNSNVIADAKADVIEHITAMPQVEDAFSSFERYFDENPYTMDAMRYVGIVLIDGLSMTEEKIMDLIGNETNVNFIGGSAGDDGQYKKTYVCVDGKAYTDAALLVLVKINEHAEFSFIKTQSFKTLDYKLTANKVHLETREVVEFNGKPAALAYAEALGVNSVDEAPDYFFANPVGLAIGDNDLFVRSPRRVIGTNIQFYCSILEGMEVQLLEPANIIEDTTHALERAISQLGRIDGIINFQCIHRTIEIENKGLAQAYGEIFSGIPTVGFSTYGEEFIGHMNQTSAMLVIKVNKENIETTQGSSVYLTPHQKQKFLALANAELLLENSELQKKLQERNQQLDEAMAAIKEFNIVLEREMDTRSKREEEITYLSYHDKLTGLYNRRFYEEEIKRLDTSRNLPISIIMGDVNELKLVNDSFGHEKGDELLQKAAASIQSACRKDDIVARWGGDEFVILLPRTDIEEAKCIVHRIKTQCAKEYVNNLSVRISLGWDTKNQCDEDLLHVLKRAEDYMYKHKALDNDINRSPAILSINHVIYENN
ncbi:diguanylate cyclase [Dehalobacter sp. DCM]|uniref:sensor domain-containing diguanylate cyclase n=1 Tax=Dehalobacter sp. DCM TaxID=2907827 RepID=UPI003081C02F|nr:diguanylate cyclase [Dehalobacter sp. DCM]